MFLLDHLGSHKLDPEDFLGKDRLWDDRRTRSVTVVSQGHLYQVSAVFASPPYVRIEGCDLTLSTQTRRTMKLLNRSSFQGTSSPLPLPG